MRAAKTKMQDARGDRQEARTKRRQEASGQFWKPVWHRFRFIHNHISVWTEGCGRGVGEGGGRGVSSEEDKKTSLQSSMLSVAEEYTHGVIDEQWGIHHLMVFDVRFFACVRARVCVVFAGGWYGISCGFFSVYAAYFVRWVTCVKTHTQFTHIYNIFFLNEGKEIFHLILFLADLKYRGWFGKRALLAQLFFKHKDCNMY